MATEAVEIDILTEKRYPLWAEITIKRPEARQDDALNRDPKFLCTKPSRFAACRMRAAASLIAASACLGAAMRSAQNVPIPKPAPKGRNDSR